MVAHEKTATALHADRAGGLQGHPARCRPVLGRCCRAAARIYSNHSPLGKRALPHPLPGLSPAALACWACHAGRWLGGLVIRARWHPVESHRKSVPAGGHGLSGVDLRAGKALAGISTMVEEIDRDKAANAACSGGRFRLAVLVPLQVIPTHATLHNEKSGF
jgi:hypothetical protein